MDKLNCHLYLPHPRLSEGHLHQVVTGFLILAKQKVIQLKMEISDAVLPSMIKAVINHSTVIAYDMADGYYYDLERVQNFISDIDIIFKRSYNVEEHQKYSFGHKLHPWGLNYYVTTQGNPLDKKYNSLIGQLKWHLKERLGINYHQRFYVEHFEAEPQEPNGPPKILFMTRTWGPEEGPDISQEEFHHINETRASCIRSLRAEFGNQFTGGFAHRKEAIEQYADCLIDPASSLKENYLRILRQSDICIATMGLLKSNGWKLAEYTAASKAICSEALYYTVPHYYQGTHYFEFHNSDECLRQVSLLFDHPSLIMEMKRKNHEYYQNYLRPDKMVMSSLLLALEPKLLAQACG